MNYRILVTNMYACGCMLKDLWICMFASLVCGWVDKVCHGGMH